MPCVHLRHSRRPLAPLLDIPPGRSPRQNDMRKPRAYMTHKERMISGIVCAVAIGIIAGLRALWLWLVG